MAYLHQRCAMEIVDNNITVGGKIEKTEGQIYVLNFTFKWFGYMRWPNQK